MECPDELKCDATGKPGKLSLIERRCSVNRSASRRNRCNSVRKN